MTREEAIKELNYIADEMPSMECRDWKEAICIAIKALQEPFINKPCISEGACRYHTNIVLNEIRTKITDLAYKDPSEDYEYGYNNGLQRAINEFSSVTPQSKTGKWIEKDYFFEHGSAKCSCCNKRDHVIGQDTYHGGYIFTFHDYCPNCGAKMRSLNNE